jgi:hypothetical protein
MSLSPAFLLTKSLIIEAEKLTQDQYTTPGSREWFRELGLAGLLSGILGEMGLAKCLGDMWVSHVSWISIGYPEALAEPQY